MPQALEPSITPEEARRLAILRAIQEGRIPRQKPRDKPQIQPTPEDKLKMSLQQDMEAGRITREEAQRRFLAVFPRRSVAVFPQYGVPPRERQVGEPSPIKIGVKPVMPTPRTAVEGAVEGALDWQKPVEKVKPVMPTPPTPNLQIQPVGPGIPLTLPPALQTQPVGRPVPLTPPVPQPVMPQQQQKQVGIRPQGVPQYTGQPRQQRPQNYNELLDEELKKRQASRSGGGTQGIYSTV